MNPHLNLIDQKKYKFRELKAYASTEWLADNRKKYRQVFDRHDTSYLYAELSFYNKEFDVEDWDVTVDLRCYAVKKAKKELCNLRFTRKVSKYDHVFYVREGWGNKAEGVFWKKGSYFWEAFIDGEKVATKYFYVEEAARPMEKTDNPYGAITQLKLYEGPYDDVLEFDRLYMKKFSGEETRYIYSEVLFRNLMPAKSWQMELFIKFYNDARELKGQIVRLHKVEKGDDIIKITAGWGSNVKGSWRNDRYTCEVVFMDTILAVMPFEVAIEYEEGTNPSFLPGNTTGVLLEHEEFEDTETFDDLMKKLDTLIGLGEIKKQVREHSAYIQFLQLRREKGFLENESINVHSVFIGNPGTGKTTVANMMGRLYKKMGLLSKGHVHEVDRVDLVGEYIGQTAPKVKEAIEMARGGVLFIDEAYALARTPDDSKDFGREVIEILVKEMSSTTGDIAIIVAGYPKEMKQFLDSNPGIKSRFKLHFEFADYLPQELSLIADFCLREKEVNATAEARRMIDDLITDAFRRRDKSFGNARFVDDLVEKAKLNLGLRVMGGKDPSKLSNDELSTIQLDDISRVKLLTKKALPEIPIDEPALDAAMHELANLIGMQNIKNEMAELVRLIRFYRDSDKDVLKRFFLHTVFIGNPGTGKTTVARILTRIYKSLGVLERGHMVETDRQGIVAGFVGQTAIKTAEKIEESMGGVLFIDEAYALTGRSSGSAAGGGDFGDEAVQTLLKRMEDNRGEFFVFVAGYPENMDNFLKANPGLSSRFDKILRFEDYAPEELLEIAIKMFSDEGFGVSEEAKEHLKNYLTFLHQFRDKYFGNARTVRATVAEAIKYQNLRLAGIPKTQRGSADLQQITLEDVANFTLDKDKLNVFQRRGIGFSR